MYFVTHVTTPMLGTLFVLHIGVGLAGIVGYQRLSTHHHQCNQHVLVVGLLFGTEGDWYSRLPSQGHLNLLTLLSWNSKPVANTFSSKTN
jgi:hypothetical protein